jgi:hypothetical protein
MVLRRFVLESFNEQGVIVEVTDYKTGALLTAPPFPK